MRTRGEQDASEETANRSGGRLNRRSFVRALLGALGGLGLARLGANPAEARLGRTYTGAGTSVLPSHSAQAIIALPDVRGLRGLSLEEAIERRRSRRAFSGAPLDLTELARLLFAAQGITQVEGGLRAAPSAGALYPVEVYAVVHIVDGLEPGIYHYLVEEHALETRQNGDFRSALAEAGLGQGHLSQANVAFVLSSVPERTRWKYRERTERYVLLEVGHIGQNLCLAATSMGLGACPVGAFWDDQLNRLLGLDGVQETAQYIIAVGKL